ncbi:hypothetical protein Tco_0069121 [Tanacetum coccineum]
MTHAQALTAIQTMVDHSQKWHDGSSSRNIESNSNTERIAAIVGCQLCGGAHLDKVCPLNEEVKSVEEVKNGEFGCSSPFSNGAKYRVGPPGYYTHIDNRPPFGEKWPSLEELMNKHLKESTRRRDEMEEWLTKVFHAKNASEVPYSSVDQCMAVYANDKEAVENTCSNETNEVSFLANNEAQVAQEKDDVPTKVFPCQLPPKELNL